MAISAHSKVADIKKSEAGYFQPYYRVSVKNDLQKYSDCHRPITFHYSQQSLRSNPAAGIVPN